MGSCETNQYGYKSFKISNESPVGAGIIGKKVGDVVDVEVPMGVVQYKILDIQK